MLPASRSSAAGSVMAALLPTSTLIGGRAIMGLGAAASEPGTLSIIRHLLPGRRTSGPRPGVWAASPAWRWPWARSLEGCWSGWAAGGHLLVQSRFGGAIFLMTLLSVPETSIVGTADLILIGLHAGPAALGRLRSFGIIQGEDLGYLTRCG